MAAGTRVGVNSHDGWCLLSTHGVHQPCKVDAIVILQMKSQVQGGQINHPNSQWQNQCGAQV